MIEVKISIAAPELSEAINKLADALNARAGNSVFHDCDCEKVSVDNISDNVSQPVSTDVAKQSTDAPAEAQSKPSKKKEKAKPAPVVKYTLDQLGRAGAELMNQDRTKELIDLLATFNVKALSELSPDNYPAFAEGLIQLGAVIPEAA